MTYIQNPKKEKPRRTEQKIIPMLTAKSAFPLAKGKPTRLFLLLQNRILPFLIMFTLCPFYPFFTSSLPQNIYCGLRTKVTQKSQL